MTASSSRADRPDHPPPTELARSCAAGALAPVIRDLLERGISVQVRVTGRSMAPAVGDGDVVTICRVPATGIRTGDILMTASAAGRLLVHRVIESADPEFRTMGDRLEAPDPSVGVGEVLGRVIRVERSPGGGTQDPIDLTTPAARIQGRLRAYRNSARWLMVRARIAVSRLIRRRGPFSR